MHTKTAREITFRAIIVIKMIYRLKFIVSG